MTDTNHPAATESYLFPQEVTGLPEAMHPAVVEIADGDVVSIGIATLRKEIAGVPVRMLAYNGSIPGPTLRVRQGSTATVHVTNDVRPPRRRPAG